MTPTSADQPVIWLIALLALVACWPIAQAFRHDRLHPLAAWLLFTSVFALVSAAAFRVLIGIGSAVLTYGALENPALAAIIVLASLAPGFAAGRWIVRRPQWRKMPK